MIFGRAEKAKYKTRLTVPHVLNVNGYFGNDRKLVKQIANFFAATIFQQNNFLLDKQWLVLPITFGRIVLKIISKTRSSIFAYFSATRSNPTSCQLPSHQTFFHFAADKKSDSTMI